LIDATGAPIPTSSEPHAGAVWIHARRLADGTRVIQLIDLLDQADDHWDAVRQASPRRSGWQVRWGDRDGSAPMAMSPWTAAGAARPMASAGGGRWRLPAFRRWLVVTAP
jgi:hypothetical protein